MIVFFLIHPWAPCSHPQAVGEELHECIGGSERNGREGKQHQSPAGWEDGKIPGLVKSGKLLQFANWKITIFSRSINYKIYKWAIFNSYRGHGK